MRWLNPLSVTKSSKLRHGAGAGSVPATPAAKSISSIGRLRTGFIGVLAPLAVFLAAGGFPVGPVHAASLGAEPTKVVPIGLTPGGQTYGRWAAEWWQWALGTPATTNPLVDTTGENCGVRQVDDVWFLAGSIVGPVERACTVPAGKSLFFPLLNTAFFALLDDPPEERTEEFLRDAVACAVPAEISLEIDGFEVKEDLTKFNTSESGSQSPLFNVQLPPDNLFGVDESIVPELVFSPAAEQGYYAFIRPLSVGEHTIRFHATGCFEGIEQDIEYILEIEDTE